MPRTKLAARSPMSSKSKRPRRMPGSSSDDEDSTDMPFPQTGTPVSCIRIFEAVAADKAKAVGNFVFSPCSVHLLLSLLANGSKGSTLEELLAFTAAKDLESLNSVARELIYALTVSTKKGPKLSSLSAVWVDHAVSLNPKFKSITEDIYKGKAEAVDFGNEAKDVADKANQWAKSATNGLISSLVSESNFDSTTKLALANALYFKGKWTRYQFVPSKTKESKFYLLDGNSVEAPFMGTNDRYQFIKVFDDVKVLRLPYKKGVGSKQALSMYIILPSERLGLKSLMENLASDSSFFEKHTSQNTKRVKVGRFMVPKFKITYKFEASEILKGIGLQLPFTDEAEFDEMVLNSRLAEPLKVSEVVHLAHVEVNEEGTEAAACSLATMAAGCSMYKKPDPQVDFVADHTFLFAIKDDKSGTVLFMGQVVNPLLQ